MNKASVKIFVLVVFVIGIIAIAGSSFAFAYWGGNPTKNINGVNSPVVDNENDITYKYLIFEVNDLASGNFYLKYSDTYSKFVSFTPGYENESIATITSGTISTLTSGSVTSLSNITLSVVAYYGTAGEYESIVIPSSINATIDSTDLTLAVTIVDFVLLTDDILFGDALDLIKSVIIPSSIVEISGASFTGWGNLSSVYFNSTTIPATIDEYCFYGSTITFYKLNASGDYVTTTIN